MRFFLFLLLFMNSISLYSIDTVKVSGGRTPWDVRQNYPHRILQAALEATIEEYGTYELIGTGVGLTRNRALAELLRGELINVHVAPTRPEWETSALVVKIPVMKGLLSYRLLLIKRSDSDLFSTISTIDELKSLKAGSGTQWSTTIAMEEAGFKIEKSTNYESLFKMLNIGRFDYFPRGLTEVFEEFDNIIPNYPSLIIDESILLYMFTPTYFFICPNNPELSERIQVGMERIIDNGTLDILFYERFGEVIERSNLQNRRIISIENPLIADKAILEVDKYWFSIPDF